MNFGFQPKNQSQFRRRSFFFFNLFIYLFFWRPPDFGRKKPLNFGFRPKNQSQFRRRPFFFWRPPDFGRKKPSNFRAFREILSEFSDKPCETDSEESKFGSKSFALFSLFQNSSPLFQILATRLDSCKAWNTEITFRFTVSRLHFLFNPF